MFWEVILGFWGHIHSLDRMIQLSVRQIFRPTICAAFVVAIVIGHAIAQQNPTLGDVLRGQLVPFSPMTIPNLDKRITSFAMLNDDRTFLIAYYLDTPENLLRFPIFITSLDKETGNWRHKALHSVRVTVFENSDHPIQDDCLGSVISVERSEKRYFLNLHFNPSAGCLIILNLDLSVDHTFGGSLAAVFKSGLIV
jgi:hypothetical protein